MTTAAATTAFVAKVGDKFTATLGTTVLGSSKHEDYFEYHLRKGDVKALREAGITHVAYVDDKGTVVRTEDVTKPKARAAVAAKPAAADPAPTTAVAPADAVTASAGAVEPAPSAVVDAEAVASATPEAVSA